MPSFAHIVSFVLLSAFSVCVHALSPGYPSGKVYGVNIGGWLVLEPWMLPAEWTAMGGQICNDCTTCIGSEFSLVQAYPDTADAKFEQHWTTWFTQDDVEALVSAGINTVRIPLGFWIVEPLVNRSSEYFPRGGIVQLQRGVQMLKSAGIAVLLDHHALPGVQTADQSFTGQCSNDVEFYTDYNYQRALTWTAVITAVTHLDPAFSSVFAVEAVNEPIMNADETPNYGTFQQNFVSVVRAVESALLFPDSQSTNATAALHRTASASTDLNPAVQQALLAAVPILVQVAVELSIGLIFSPEKKRELALRTPLNTAFMDVNWQYNDPSNPAAAQNGPQIYDNHLYYSFGGVADANEEAYLESICNLKRVQADAALGDSPLIFGEWGLATQFTATDDFLYQWADAQKLAYSQGAGWIYWNFKVEKSELAGNLSRQWSYLDAVELGYFSSNPAELLNPDVCATYTT